MNEPTVKHEEFGLSIDFEGRVVITESQEDLERLTAGPGILLAIVWFREHIRYCRPCDQQARWPDACPSCGATALLRGTNDRTQYVIGLPKLLA